MSPGALEHLLDSVKRPIRGDLASRLLAGRAHNEDAAVVGIPPAYAIAQTVDVLAPIVNDAYAFGKIAAANALSDIYAMGGIPWCAMSLAFFPPELARNENNRVLADILRGSLDIMEEAGVVPAGGHTVQDEELKFGLAVTGLVDPEHIASNDGLRVGQQLLLTKPLGTGILATAVKAHWEFAVESEQEIIKWCALLNSAGGEAIRRLHLEAATDVTGFGLGGHALELAKASDVCVRLRLNDLPLMPHVLEYAADGLIPAGSHANGRHFLPLTRTPDHMDEGMQALISVVFDTQTSGGLLLAVPEDKLEAASAILLEHGHLAAPIGDVLPKDPDGKLLLLE